MKKFIKNLSLSRVSHSPHYSLLISDSQSPRASKTRSSTVVPEGHLPVYVGEEMRRFVISAKLVNHPILVHLLEKSAQEYGYEGVLRIPCPVVVFERLLEGLRLGDDSVWDLVNL